MMAAVKTRKCCELDISFKNSVVAIAGSILVVVLVGGVLAATGSIGEGSQTPQAATAAAAARRRGPSVPPYGSSASPPGSSSWVDSRRNGSTGNATGNASAPNTSNVSQGVHNSTNASSSEEVNATQQAANHRRRGTGPSATPPPPPPGAGSGSGSGAGASYRVQGSVVLGGISVAQLSQPDKNKVKDVLVEKVGHICGAQGGQSCSGTDILLTFARRDTTVHYQIACQSQSAANAGAASINGNMADLTARVREEGGVLAQVTCGMFRVRIARPRMRPYVYNTLV